MSRLGEVISKMVYSINIFMFQAQSNLNIGTEQGHEFSSDTRLTTFVTATIDPYSRSTIGKNRATIQRRATFANWITNPGNLSTALYQNLFPYISDGFSTSLVTLVTASSGFSFYYKS